ncbi:MAG: hypothetical protein ABW217_04105 [Polyangiaceae bacterium]
MKGLLRRARLPWVLALGFACSAEPSVSDVPVPPPDDFAPVSAVLAHGCGSLDCHGRAGQNLRLYGDYGLRLDPEDIPGGDEMTAAEHQANYESVVVLEPEALSSVWLERGRDPERLTLIRKARGREAHKGGSVFWEGDAGDRCLRSWLSGAIDVATCTSAAELTPSPYAP